MANETKETILIDVQIDQKDAQKQLVATEKSLLSLKKQAADLRKEYNAGKISEDKYVESNLQLQNAIKKETEQKRTLTKLVETESNSRNALKARISQLTKEYDNLNKSEAAGAKRADELAKELKELNAEVTKSSKEAGLFKDQIGNYANAFKQAGSPLGAHIEQVQQFGASTEDVVSKIGLLGAAATGAVAVIGALGAAYLSSSTGAKDLAFAQDRLRFTTGGLIEAFGTMVGGSGEGGTGLLNQLIDGFGDYLSILPIVQGYTYLFEKATGVSIESINEQSKAAAIAAENLRKLGIEAVRVAGYAKLFEKAAEDARRIRDDESKALEDRLQATNAVQENLSANEKVRINVLNQEIEALKASNVNWKNKDDIVLQVEQKTAEIRDIEEEVNGKLTENITARRNILKLIQDQANLEAGVAAANKRIGTGPGVFSPVDKRSVSQAVLDAKSTADLGVENQAAIEQQTQQNITHGLADELDIRLNMTEKFNADLVKFNNDAYTQDVENKRRAAALKQELDQQENTAALMAADQFIGAIGSLFDQESAQYKLTASARAVINTYLAATAALASGSEINPIFGIVSAAAAVANGLASVAQINGVQFAEGGWTGPGQKYDAVGVVHADEYVVPKRINNSPSAQPHIAALESMRTRGFADGGFTTNESTSASQQALIMANALRHMPPPVVEVAEVSRLQRRIEVREKLSTL